MPTFFEKSPHNSVSQSDSPASVFELADWFDTLQKEHEMQKCSTPLQQVQALVNVGFLFPILSQYITDQCHKALEKHNTIKKQNDSKYPIVQSQELNPDIIQYEKLYYQLRQQENSYKQQGAAILRKCHHIDWKQENVILPDSISSTHINVTKQLFNYIEQFLKYLQLKESTHLTTSESAREYKQIAIKGKKLSAQLKERSDETRFLRSCKLSLLSPAYQDRLNYWGNVDQRLDKKISITAQYIKLLLGQHKSLNHPQWQQENNLIKLNDIFNTWEKQVCWSRHRAILPAVHIESASEESFLLLRRQSTIRFDA